MKGFFWNDDIEEYFPGEQFQEIFKQRIYAPYIESKQSPVIIDIGANIGIFSLYASKYGKVYAVEPSKEHFDLLTHMIEFNKIPVTPVQAAIGKSEGKMAFYHTPINKTMYSLVSDVPGKGPEVEEVDVITLSTLFSRYHIDHVDLLKLDVEGVEGEILGGSSFAEEAKKIDTVVVEYHTWSGRHPNQLRQALENVGFTVTQIPNEATLFVGIR